MMDWTTRDCRFFHRLMSQHTLLYTEMVTTGALIHNDPARWLDYNAEEHPLALQLGGSNPAELAKCTKFAEEWGYDEVNLNVGCPSDRVQNNMIGACLMAHPNLVKECLGEMQAAVSIPVTVKHRLGIDDLDSYELLEQFVETVAESGITSFTIHARKAILDGLSPKQNREVPPLIYDNVYKIKQRWDNCWHGLYFYRVIHNLWWKSCFHFSWSVFIYFFSCLCFAWGLFSKIK